MVVVLSSAHLKYKINENDHNPPHVHVEGLGTSIRINLNTLEPMDKKTDFNAATVNRIIQLVTENKNLLLEQWESVHGK